MNSSDKSNESYDESEEKSQDDPSLVLKFTSSLSVEKDLVTNFEALDLSLDSIEKMGDS